MLTFISYSCHSVVDLVAHGVRNTILAPTVPYEGSVCFGDRLQYTRSVGTSNSAAYVSGIAALLWSAKPDATAVEIRDALLSTALDLGAPGRDEVYGHGFVSVKDALDYLLFGPVDIDM